MDLTELTDTPEIIETDEDNISINRWTEYGHDRLYINGARGEMYIDLQTGKLSVTGQSEIVIDEDTKTIEVTRRTKGTNAEKTTVIALAPDDSPETEQDAEPTPEHIDEAGYSKAAGQAQQIEAQRLIADGGRDDSTIILGYDDGDRVYTRLEDGESRDYGFVPSSVFGGSDPINFEEETELADLRDAPGRRTVLDAFTALDTDSLVAGLVEETEWTQREAQMVVYRGWFGLSPEDFRDEVGITSKTISNHTGAAENRQIRARTTTEVSSFLSDRRTDSTLILDADVREELDARKRSRKESTESVIGRLLDQTVAMDNRQSDTFSDVLGLVEQWIQEGEAPFNPSEMDEETQDAWLNDLNSLERIHSQYAGREFSPPSE